MNKVGRGFTGEAAVETNGKQSIPYGVSKGVYHYRASGCGVLCQGNRLVGVSSSSSEKSADRSETTMDDPRSRLQARRIVEITTSQTLHAMRHPPARPWQSRPRCLCRTSTAIRAIERRKKPGPHSVHQTCLLDDRLGAIECSNYCY